MLNSRGRGQGASWRRLSGWPRRAIATLLIAAGCLSLLGNGVLSPNPHRDATRDVIVAAKALSTGQTVATNDIRLERWPTRLVSTASPERPSDVVGRTVGGPLDPGELITSARLLDMTIARSLAPDEVAVTVQLSDPAQGVTLAPGSRIDLYPAVDSGSASTGAGRTSTAPLLPDVLVLAVLPAADADSSVLPGNSSSSRHLVIACQRSAVAPLARLSTSGFVASLRPPL